METRSLRKAGVDKVESGENDNTTKDG